MHILTYRAISETKENNETGALSRSVCAREYAKTMVQSTSEKVETMAMLPVNRKFGIDGMSCTIMDGRNALDSPFYLYCSTLRGIR